jgi:light-regulated signal transduction histidine kinase (bacteriophytochrome)
MSNSISVHFDGNTYNHTEESLIGLIKSEDYNKKLSEEWKDKFSTQRSNVYNIREKVNAFFNSYYSVGDTEITVELDEVNALLESIGAETLKKTWSADVVIYVSVNNIEAADEDSVIDYVQNEIEVSYTHSGDYHVEDIQVTSVQVDC